AESRAGASHWAERRIGPRSEDKPRLQLEHARRIHVRESGERGGGGPDGDELAERGARRLRVAVDGLSAAEIVAVIEEVEPLQAQEDGRALRGLDPPFDEGGDVLGPGAAVAGLAQYGAVHHRPVVVGPVAVVVDARGRVERARRGQ